jgi:hypothetical protein
MMMSFLLLDKSISWLEIGDQLTAYCMACHYWDLGSCFIHLLSSFPLMGQIVFASHLLP